MIKRTIFLFLLILSFTVYAEAQKNTLSGYIYDADNGESLIGATVSIKSLSIGTSTNAYGFYSISLKPGKYKITYSYLGYNSIETVIDLNSDQTKNIELGPDNVQINDVIVRAQRKDKNVSSVQMSVERVSIATVKKMPHFLGEVDIIKTLQMLPGVSTVGEGSTGFNVRGSASDQNLILLDEAPVYNSSHLFGFFSVFNGDAVKDFELYKGGIPAKYGGRLASVLEVRQKEGNMKRFSGSGGLGIVSSRLTLEAPIIKDKTSFMIAARRSYADIFMRMKKANKDNSAYFYDLNLKINHKFNNNNRLYASMYLGDDVFNFGKDFNSRWGNKTASLRWNHLFNNKTFSNFTAIYSKFDYALGIPEGSTAFEWKSAIENYKFKADIIHYLTPESKLRFGASSTYYVFNPGEFNPLGKSILKREQIDKNNSIETAAYIDVETDIASRLKLRYGLRVSNFAALGGNTINNYADNKPLDTGNITSTKKYAKNKIVKNYFSLEPRLSIQYSLRDDKSIKMSYNRTTQNIHKISNTTSPTPVDIWVSANKYINAAKADQIALGYFQNLLSDEVEISLEGYYKKMYNLVEYKHGAQLILNKHIETELLKAKGRAYGLEFTIRKKEGKFTGWIAYTLSKAEKKVDSQINKKTGKIYPSTEINNGDYFPTNYDKTHDFKIVANYDISNRWSVSANFMYSTGRPISYPNSKYTFQDQTYLHYSKRNDHRIPSYHRLDIAFNYKCKKKRENQNWQGSWNFGLTNVYGRKNAYSISVDTSNDSYSSDTKLKAKQLSIIGMPIPTVTYNFTF